MRALIVLPVLTAVLAIVCALWPPARRFALPVAVLAAINVVLTPVSSGEWFYQIAEHGSYEQAVARGDFTAFDNLLDEHDPRLEILMVGLAVLLMIGLAFLALLQFRSRHGKTPSPALWMIAAGATLIPALATLVQVYRVVTGP